MSLLWVVGDQLQPGLFGRARCACGGVGAPLSAAAGLCREAFFTVLCLRRFVSADARNLGLRGLHRMARADPFRMRAAPAFDLIAPVGGALVVEFSSPLPSFLVKCGDLISAAPCAGMTSFCACLSPFRTTAHSGEYIFISDASIALIIDVGVMPCAIVGDLLARRRLVSPIACSIDLVTTSAYMMTWPLIWRAARPVVWMSERAERR